MVKNTSNRLANFTPIAIMAEDKQLLFIGDPRNTRRLTRSSRR
jgi:hypothetical protein